MEIILKETIDTLGREGEIVKVKPGYARNYLFPTGKAVPVTKASLARLEQEKQAIAARLAAQQAEARTLAEKLDGQLVVIPRRAGDENRLFGSVTTADIAEALGTAGLSLDRKVIVLAEPIKVLGEYRVQVRTGYQTTAQLVVQVVPEEAATPEEN
ncbi:50S ribosomal protein L9 [Desulfobulbus oralis]|uniref:Large ribosomal subunit protein bL9 n=1 Tax=Desulfobulbus oralis TaxID=1986146 RepID=A0A2L1GQM5_9BACT|nr:50S ribosomal protein L9 [Desulfobulbus oralis]AVD71981.1 50S ribosomal protein L9 [Desulfobulbus oralis]